jgi:predicted negative regulator of RcsB-dependent stress response
METDPTVALYDFYGWLHTNRKRVLAGAVVVAVIAAIVGFVMWSNSQKEASADQALLAAPSILGVAAPGDPSAVKALLTVSQDYSGTSAGAAAQMLAARELYLGGKYAEAQEEFTKFIAAHPGHPLVAQANVGIAACLEARDKIPDAVQQYKKITSLYSTSPNIIIPIKLTLGRLSEADNKPDQAVQNYKDLVMLQDPNDPWVAEASERLRLLVAKHPELNPFPPQPGAAAASPVLNPTEAEMQLLAPPGSAAPGSQPAAPAPNTTPAPPPAAAPQASAPPAVNQNIQMIPPATNATPAGNP